MKISFMVQTLLRVEIFHIKRISRNENINLKYLKLYINKQNFLLILSTICYNY